MLRVDRHQIAERRHHLVGDPLRITIAAATMYQPVPDRIERQIWLRLLQPGEERSERSAMVRKVATLIEQRRTISSGDAELCIGVTDPFRPDRDPALVATLALVERGFDAGRPGVQG